MDASRSAPIHLLCCADAAYAAWAGVMLASVLRIDHGAALHIHLLSDGIDAPTLRRIGDMAEAGRATLHVHDVGPALEARAGTLPLVLHLSRATYARLFLADCLPPAVERVIYLDVDVVCRGALRALWDVDLGGAVAAAARDCAIGADPVGDLAAAARMARDRHAARLGLPPDGTYFNSGVMLIDVRRWRHERISAAAMQWLAAHPERVGFADQDPLNAVLRGRIAWLDDDWNWLAWWAWREPAATVKIIHFAGPDKPWHADYQGKGAAAWRAAKAASPFRGVKLLQRDGARAPGALERLLRRSPMRSAGARRVRVRPTGGARIETSGGVEVICNDPDGLDVFVHGPHVALPPGAYAAAFHLAVLEDMPGRGDAAGKRVRFQICLLSGTKSIAMLEIGVPPDAVLRDMPVMLDFVLPGPVRDLECWLTASPGVRAALRCEVVLTRRRDAWRSALAG